MYVSVFGDERGKKVAIEGLKAKTKYVRSQIGRRMKLRLTPEIRFIEDESMERGSRVGYKFICFYGIRIHLCLHAVNSVIHLFYCLLYMVVRFELKPPVWTVAGAIETKTL